jgi:hypothetical protein
VGAQSGQRHRLVETGCRPRDRGRARRDVVRTRRLPGRPDERTSGASSAL